MLSKRNQKNPNMRQFVFCCEFIGPNKSTSMKKLSAILIAVLLLFNFYLIFDHDKYVILADTHADHYRCSHVPPPPEQVRHVWLEDSNFTIAITHDQSGSSASFGRYSQELEHASTSSVTEQNLRLKSKRHIVDSRHKKDSFASSPVSNANNQESISQNQSANDDNSVSGGSIQDTLWSLLKKLERPILGPLTQQKSPNDLVPMQIQVHYDSSVYSLEKKKLDLINGSVIPSVVKFFENVLSIKRKYTIDRFRIARRCPNNTIYYARDVVGLSRPYCMDHCEDHAICGEMVVPREHLSACSYCSKSPLRCTTDYTTEGKGVADTQLLLYVSAKQTTRCKKDQTIAYAAHCAQDAKTDRPVAGHANLCPMSISTDPRDLKALISTVKHELTHVLGFSVSLFAYYRDENGRPLLDRKPMPGPIPVDPKTGYAKWSDKVIKKVVRSNWLTGEGPIDKEIHLMVTPTVVREVRRHFNCSTLEGAELEDQGSDGTSMTHWEKRLFENEAMTGTHTQNSVYSRLTLAVLQDTGWYVANFSRAERLEWGKDLGCDFAKKSCKSWIDERRTSGQSIRPFCDRIKGDLLQIACTEDLSSKAVCNMRRFKEPLPAVYQNFDQLEGLTKDEHEAQLAHYGGSVDLADYCPFIQEFTWQAHNVSLRGSRCDLGTNTIEPEKNAALEHYGPESRCFEHGRRWEQRTCQYKRSWHHYGAGCYRYSCSNDHVNIIVGNHSYPCYYLGQIIHIEQVVNQWLYNGTLVCPSCEKICPANKCQTYDGRIIDLILHRAYSSDLKVSSNREELLRSIFDEAFNMIDGNSGEAVISQESPAKYLPILTEVSKLIDHRRLVDQPSLLARLRESSPYIFTFPGARPNPAISTHGRHPLVCSSGNSISSKDNWNIPKLLTCLLISLVGANVLRHH